MASAVRMLTFVAWSLTLSLFVLKVHVNASGSVQNQWRMNTSGCNSPNTIERPNSPLASILPSILRHNLAHYSGLFQNFRITLLASIATALNASRDWETTGTHVPVHERGLRDLYPMSNETEMFTAAGPGNKHRILRESRWLLTSVEAHVQLLNATNTTLFRDLADKTRDLSIELRHLLTSFHVSGLPAQAKCVHTSLPQTVSTYNVSTFTSMAVRDIHQALVHVYDRLGSCETHWLCSYEIHGQDPVQHRPRLCCSEASVFYPTMPQGLRWLYHYTAFLSS